MRILVPIDSSTSCLAAQNVAFQLGGAIPGAELHAIHVVNVRTASGNLINDLSGYAGFEPVIVAADVYEASLKAAQALVDQFVNRALAEGLRAAGQVVQGPVTRCLVEASHHADLVVMGLRGVSDDRYPGQGGAQTREALPQMGVPVLLVPRTVSRINGFAVGYDGSPSSSHALRAAVALGALQVPMQLIYIGDTVPSPDPLDAAAAAIPATFTADVHKHYHTKASVHEGLVEAAAEANANLLCLGFKGDHPLRNALFGSAREHLVDHDTPLALLIAR